jgi:urea transport system ATP-binding protein
VLEVARINQYYGESHILWDMSLDVPEGSCTVLMGRNGVGKTTLLKSILGLLPVKTGQVAFCGKPINGLRPETRARAGLGYVPQGREIFPQLTVRENLRLGLVGTNQKDIPERVLELFPVLKSMFNRRGGDLSGGQQQQLAIGRALAKNPKLLILDEPCEGIQPNIVSEIGEILAELNKQQKLTILLVEQKLSFARKLADQFCMMERGRKVAQGPISDLTDDLIGRHLAV